MSSVQTYRQFRACVFSGEKCNWLKGSRSVIEKLIFIQLVKKFPAFCVVNRMLNNVRHVIFTLSQINPIHANSLRYILILFYQEKVDIIAVLYSFFFLTKLCTHILCQSIAHSREHDRWNVMYLTCWQQCLMNINIWYWFNIIAIFSLSPCTFSMAYSKDNLTCG